MKTKSQIGKASKAAGSRFELKVRKDLEDKGWTVSKWMNNVEFTKLIPTKATKQAMEMFGNFGKLDNPEGKLVPAKHKFRGPGIPMAIGTGFPDFITYKRSSPSGKIFWINGVEAKSNGYLDKVEKEKCTWLLDNKIFAKILIAKKGTKRGEIEYNEFENKPNK